MRELKFRAYDRTHKRMWNILSDDLDELEWEEYLSMGYAFVDMVTGNQKRFIFMQYTELDDKNGCCIYEGDKVKFKYHDEEILGVVKWDNIELLWFIEEQEVMLVYKLGDIYSSEIEVIGNIYENWTGV